MKGEPRELTCGHRPGRPWLGCGAPNLPEGFTDTFTSRYVNTGDLRQHVITGDDASART